MRVIIGFVQRAPIGFIGAGLDRTCLATCRETARTSGKTDFQVVIRAGASRADGNNFHGHIRAIERGIIAIGAERGCPTIRREPVSDRQVTQRNARCTGIHDLELRLDVIARRCGVAILIL